CCAGRLCASGHAPPANLDQLVADGKPTVVVFLGVECPLAKLYAQRLSEMNEEYAGRISFAGLDPNVQDGVKEISDFSDVHEITFPLSKDEHQAFARQLKATRTPEAFLLSPTGAVLYQGRVDDQYQPGTNRGNAPHNYLRDAIDATLAGRPVDTPFTEAVGCLIRLQPDDKSPEPSVTYAREIAPILYRRCVSCHRDGQVAPFSLTSYDETAPWSEMIVEVVQDGRMPPWGADPRHGRFSNDPTLTDEERQLIFAWAKAGAPEGNANDLPALPTFPPDGWQIKTDVVYSMPEPFTVPAEGVLEYQTFIINPQLEDEKLVQAVQIRPGNMTVVHHAGVALRPRGAQGGYWRVGELNDMLLAMYIPGQPILRLPAGVAKRLPADCEMVLQIHYVTVGSEQTDRTQVGIQWARPEDVQYELATWVIVEEDYEIPAREAKYEVSFSWTVDRDVQLRALYPHMHLRGKSAEILASYPDGRNETLLFVPRYDFSWQHRYELAVPKDIPQGTELRMNAVFDNSAANPNNPDPSVIVQNGERTIDEMCQTYFEVCVPYVPPQGSSNERVSSLLLACAAVLSLYGGFNFVNRRKLMATSN
ncbi:MAG TPA: redoxin domain-containing protein, partial [Pirellulales bacterium]|nr:redoxin domain-containing protein [Pirellulales bacterium]